MKKRTVCFISDFFYPQYGGVETHIFSLCQELIKADLKVIVVTGNILPGRQGVRYMTNGLKVYYLPLQKFYDGNVVGTLFFQALPYLRDIVVRERVDILHCHQVTSTLATECILYAHLLGCRVLLTCHSLYPYGKLSTVGYFSFARYFYCFLDHAICVSHACKDSFVLNSGVDYRSVSVIPNAIASERFTPDESRRPDPQKRINVVLISRLEEKKGIDLVIEIIPPICAKHPRVHFLIVGSGSKKIDIEEMRKEHQLNKRVEITGRVPYEKVRENLVRGHIFLNGSKTESFCLANLEALSCGLKVVTTNVGGIPEANVNGLFTMCEPSVPALLEALSRTIETLDLRAEEWHQTVRRSHSWKSVAARTISVYEEVMARERIGFRGRFQRLRECGDNWVFFLLVLLVDFLILQTLEFFWPKAEIEKAADFE